MKKIALFLALAVGAQAAMLVWEHDGIGVEHYRVYEGPTVDGPFTNIGISTVTNFTLPKIKSGNHFFYATAVGTNGLESDPSNNAFARVVPPPQNTQFQR